MTTENILTPGGALAIARSSLVQHFRYDLVASFVVFLVALPLCMIVVTDLLTGVLAGMALLLAKLLLHFSHFNALVVHGEDDYCLLHLSGSATFLRLPILASSLDRVSPGREIHVDFERLDHIDHACMVLLTSFAQKHEQTGGTLIIDWAAFHAQVHGMKDSALSVKSNAA